MVKSTLEAKTKPRENTDMTENANDRPDRLDEIMNLLVGFIDETRQFMAEQKQFNAKVTEDISQLTDQVGQLTKDVGWLIDTVVWQSGELARQSRELDRQSGEIARLTDDVGQLKGFHVRAVALQRTASFARRLGLAQFHVLSHEETGDLAGRLAEHNIDENDRQSFAAADLIIEAHGDGRTKHYIAVEISYTANQDDVRRAVRNARYLQLLTGNDTHAAVVGCERTADVDTAVATGAVNWHYISNRAMSPA